jgi:branched-chain amino acid transport system substrate-binding protein
MSNSIPIRRKTGVGSPSSRAKRVQWRSTASVAVVAAAALGLSACGGSGGSSASAANNGTSQSGPITIGLIAAQTGQQALDGKLAIDAAQMAAHQINSGGGVNGRKLKVKVVNNRTTNSGTVSAFQQLSSNPNVVAIIGTAISTNTKATLDADKQAKIPYFFGGSDPSLTQQGDKWLFRTRPNDNVTAKVLAKFAKEHHVHAATVVHSTDSFGASAAKLAKTNLRKDNIKIVSSVGYTDKSSDYTATAQKVKDAHAPATVLYTTEGEDSGRLIKALVRAGVTPQNTIMIGMASAPTTPSLKIGGSAWNGTYMVADMFCGANKTDKTFCKTFKSKYNLTPDLNSAYSYDALTLIAAAVKKSGNASRTGILSGLNSLTSFKGVEPGKYQFHKHQHDPVQAEHILEVKDGKLTFLKNVELGQ